jgi:putative nucleotidyltransferase with HDIG domain
MASPAITRSTASRVYVRLVIASGASVLALSAYRLIANPPRPDFYSLAALTLISGLLPLKLPNVSANISVSETFVFAGTLMLGPASGTVLVFLDALLIWVRLAREHAQQGVKWHRMLFSLAAPALAIWTGGHLLFKAVGTLPLGYLAVEARPNIWNFAGGVIVFTAVYFWMNTWLVAFAIALELKIRAFDVWRKNFSSLWLNYLAGASIAMLLVYNTNGITWAFVLVIFPLMLVLFLTYRWSMERIEQAEHHVKVMSRTFLRTIEALAMAIDAKDQVTHGHIRRVQRYVMELAGALGVNDEKMVEALRAAALLHDTGKLAVPEYILNKPGPLTTSEFGRMKLHATIGADILKSIDFPYPVEPIVRHHHENWDGSGYPEGVKGTDIPLGARILSVVDCYDAVTSDRPYRARMTRPQAEKILRDRRGTMYDPWVVDGFLGIIDKLEQGDAEEAHSAHDHVARSLMPAQLEVIKAATLEDREFGGLRRNLPTATTAIEAAEILFQHLHPVFPFATLAIYGQVRASNELEVVACTGVGADVLQSLRVPIGERVSGWAFAHKQPALNSQGVLELGAVARTFSTPLDHALVVPVIDGNRSVAVLALFGNERFSADAMRLVESAASLLRPSLSMVLAADS